MTSPSIIPRELRQAYASSTYVLNELGDSVRIGAHSPEADRICRDAGVSTWLFITAYNPRSQRLSSSENSLRMMELCSMVSARGLHYSEGEGQGEDNTWEPERSIFVPGATRDLAHQLGLHFEQYAVVFGEVGGVAELVEIALPAGQS